MDKGLTLGASTPIKEKHNAFARAQMFAVDPVEAKEGDDVFHFVAYIPFMVITQFGKLHLLYTVYIYCYYERGVSTSWTG